MVVLKGVPRILSPQLLNVLARMGHGDEIVLADANFPAASVCRWVWSIFTSGCGILCCYSYKPELVRADGHGIPPLLKAITQLLPLDAYVPKPGGCDHYDITTPLIMVAIAMLMDLVPGDKAKGLQTPVWDVYRGILNEVNTHLIP